MSQPVAPSGSTSICSNPAMDELPLITWTRLTGEAGRHRAAPGSRQGWKSPELYVIRLPVIQQKQLMVIDAHFD